MEGQEGSGCQEACREVPRNPVAPRSQTFLQRWRCDELSRGKNWVSVSSVVPWRSLSEVLPRARHGQSQPVPAAPPQGRSGSLSRAGGTQGFEEGDFREEISVTRPWEILSRFFANNLKLLHSSLLIQTSDNWSRWELQAFTSTDDVLKCS